MLSLICTIVGVIADVIAIVCALISVAKWAIKKATADRK